MEGLSDDERKKNCVELGVKKGRSHILKFEFSVIVRPVQGQRTVVAIPTNIYSFFLLNPTTHLFTQQDQSKKGA